MSPDPRDAALSVFRQINFELLDIHRSLALKGPAQNESSIHWVTDENGLPNPVRKASEERPLANRVQNFMREAQVNYRKLTTESFFCRRVGIAAENY
jgi:hypothetical protein